MLLSHSGAPLVAADARGGGAGRPSLPASRLGSHLGKEGGGGGRAGQGDEEARGRGEKA